MRLQDTIGSYMSVCMVAYTNYWHSLTVPHRLWIQHNHDQDKEVAEDKRMIQVKTPIN